MTHEVWNPWYELERFQDDVNQLFNQGPRHAMSHEAVPVRIWVGEEGAVVTALLPGVAADSLDISVLGEHLTLRGRREAQDRGKNDKGGMVAHRRERPAGDFARKVKLPFRVDAQKVAAQYNHGILEVMLPRSPEDKPRRITVKAA